MTNPLANPPTRFAIVDSTTGAIISLGIAPANDVPNQPLSAGQKIVMLAATAVDPATQQINIATGAVIARAVPDLTSAREAQRMNLRTACTQVIERGFISATRKYPSNATDQTNLIQASIAGGNLWCATSGTWALTAHTAAQAVAVLQDFVAMRDTNRTKLATLETQLDAATTALAIAAVVWSLTAISAGS